MWNEDRSTVQKALPLLFIVLLHVSNSGRLDFSLRMGLDSREVLWQTASSSIAGLTAEPLQQIMAHRILVSHSLSQGSWQMERSWNCAGLKELVSPNMPIELSKEGLSCESGAQ